jgi:hypothetical protein
VSRWIRGVFLLRACELLDHSVSHQPGLKGIPPIRKKHTDRVFLSSACETLDQGCVSFEGL